MKKVDKIFLILITVVMLLEILIFFVPSAILAVIDETAALMLLVIFAMLFIPIFLTINGLLLLISEIVSPSNIIYLRIFRWLECVAYLILLLLTIVSNESETPYYLSIIAFSMTIVEISVRWLIKYSNKNSTLTNSNDAEYKGELMKRKILLLFILTALLLTGCSKKSKDINDVIADAETFPKCDGEHIEVDIPEEGVFSYYYFSYYKDESGNNVVVQKCTEHNKFIKKQSYADPQYVKEDFYKLEAEMDIYQIVEMVGIPCRSTTFGVSSTDFLMDDGNYVQVVWDDAMKATAFRYLEAIDE